MFRNVPPLDRGKDSATVDRENMENVAAQPSDVLFSLVKWKEDE